MDKINEIWPKWHTVELLGQGINGDVYKVKREELGEVFYSAVKIVRIPRDEAEIREMMNEGYSSQAIQKFYEEIAQGLMNEIRVMESLKSAANVVTIEEFEVRRLKDVIGWEVFIRMEFLTNLNEYCAKRTLSQEEVVKLAKDICQALICCKKNNIVHRDIKPSNIFVNEKFNIFKLGDFGIARQLEKTRSTLSQKGSDLYMAPEVRRGEKGSYNVDIYSLGLVLYRLLNKNKMPFEPCDKELCSHQERENARERRLRGEKLPLPVQADQSLGEIICRACANDKDARYQSAEEFLKVLETWEYGGKDSGYNNNGGNGEGGRSHTQFQQDKKSYADSMWQCEEDDETRGVFGKDRENSPKKPNASESKKNNNQSENHYNAGNSAGAAAVQNDHGEENLQKKKQSSVKKRVKRIVICGVVFILMGTVGNYLAKNTGNNSEITPTVTPEPEFELEPELVAEPVNELEYTVDQTPSGVSVLEAHGVYVATANLNVRQDCTMAAERVGTVPKGTILESTGVCENGWIRVIYNSETAYVSGNYVRKEE